MKIVDKIDRFVEDHKITIIAAISGLAVGALVATTTTRSANTVYAANAKIVEGGALVVKVFQKNGRLATFDWPDANLNQS